MERTYISLTFTRSSDTELPGSRPLAMCAISCTRPPFERISHCMKTSQKLVKYQIIWRLRNRASSLFTLRYVWLQLKLWNIVHKLV